MDPTPDTGAIRAAAAGPSTKTTPAARVRPRWQIWRSPAGQPGWARPVLLGLAVLAGTGYAWGMAGQAIEPYYAASVRSMSMSPHNFFFAAFDPDAMISLDKLPGALWIQVLSVTVFGLHVWAIILPQVIEGIATVLVFYRAVRRLAGPAAGLVAGAALAVMPATVALDRGNISDTLMILLLVLAADALSLAVTTGGARHVVLAGVWVGLAFQAKMVEAWLILPALAVTWLIFGRGPAWRRVGAVGGLGLVTVLISLSWMTAVTLTPAHSRPYVDGSQDNSLFEQVFVYNGVGRAEGSRSYSPANGPLSSTPLIAVTLDKSSALDRLVAGPGGRDVGWLIPLALIAGIAVAATRPRPRRDDPMLAGCVLWGGWLVVFAAAFAVGSSINAYYLAALSPPVAALVGIGAAAAVRDSRGVRWATWLAALLTAGYAAWLLSPAPAAVRYGVPIAALVLLVAGLARAGGLGRAGGLARAGRLGRTGMISLAAAVLITPLVASLSLVADGRGPFDTPFEPEATAYVTQQVPRMANRTTAALIATLRANTVLVAPSRYLLATYTSLLAAPFIFQSGDEVLAIGGFAGSAPEPDVAQLSAAVRANQVHLVIAPAVDDPRVIWVERHCLRLPVRNQGIAGSLRAYLCTPSGG